jgi:hypothetical protein
LRVSIPRQKRFFDVGQARQSRSTLFVSDGCPDQRIGRLIPDFDQATCLRLVDQPGRLSKISADAAMQVR